MAQEGLCVLGQLHGDFYRACEKFFGQRWRWYEHPLQEFWPFGSGTDIDWKAKIIKRRAKRGAK